MEPVKRPYQSPRRQAQAEATRREILVAARRLFVEHGYDATSIRAIAQAAGVAEPTVYAAFGNKRSLLLALLEDMDVAAGVAELLTELRAAEGAPPCQIAAIVAFDRRLFERFGDVLAVVGQVVSSDPEVADIARQGRDRGRRGRVPLVRAWAAAGHLRAGLTESEAVEAWLALGGPEVFRLLIGEGGWSPERYQAWMTATLCEVLLAPAARQ